MSVKIEKRVPSHLVDELNNFSSRSNRKSKIKLEMANMVRNCLHSVKTWFSLILKTVPCKDAFKHSAMANV